MSEIIKVENIKRDFLVGSETVHAIRDISFNVTEGEFVTIMGASGSGKSTLLNILGCLDVPTQGDYYLSGVQVRKMGKTKGLFYATVKLDLYFKPITCCQRQRHWKTWSYLYFIIKPSTLRKERKNLFRPYMP